MLFDAPPALTDAQFARLAGIVHEDTGIVLTQAKRGLLMARLNRRLRVLGLADYGAYCALLDGPQGAEERRNILSAVTTNVTGFFREAHHFDMLTRQVLPPLVAAARQGARVRLWSAACSSGEEAYSIAMTVLDLFPEAPRHDLLILATDIDPEMVARAQAGLYSPAALDGVAPARRAAYFTETSQGVQAQDALRAILRFAELNLHHDWPFQGLFDVVFCRNVVIYFDETARQRLWQRMAGQIPPGGHLFIGHSERLDGAAGAVFGLAGPTCYTRLDRPAPCPPSPVPLHPKERTCR